jgi:cell division protein FtsL
MPARLEKEAYEESYAYRQEPKKALPPRKRPQPQELLDQKMRSRVKVLCGVLAIMALVLTARCAISANRGYELVRTQQQAQELEQENERLKLEIAHMKSPERIKEIATKKLGMEMPQHVYYAK